MNEKINGIKFEKPFIEIISNVTSEPENDPDKIKNLLVEQIYTTVRWRESIINTFNYGTLNYIELGPGKVLCGMVKRTVKNVNCFSINTIADMENVRDEFKNKKILVTGATGGIGNCLVKKFYENGAQIVATGTNEEKLDNLKKNFSNIHIGKFQLNKHDKIEEFINTIDNKLNGLEILINNAGITLDNLSIRLSEENWKKVIEINLTSTFLMCKHSIKRC